MTFNLIDKPWVPCLMRDGSHQELSLSEVFQHAPEISRIDGDNPLQNSAILRTLLVIFWRSHLEYGDLRKLIADEWWVGEREEPDAMAVLGYLDTWRSRFDLLDPEVPFMQVADLHTEKNETKPAMLLVADSRRDHQRMRSDFDTLSLAEAARYLIQTHAWDVAGIKSGAVGDPRVKRGKGYGIGTGWCGRGGLVVLHGDSLHETMLLNTPAQLIADRAFVDDLPVWEREQQTSHPRSLNPSRSDGPCDLLTWQSRRIRLKTDNGRVAEIVIAQGDAIDHIDLFHDPMVGYQHSPGYSKQLGVDAHIPKRHASHSTRWRGLKSLMVVEGEGSQVSRLPATLEWVNTLRANEDIGEDETFSVELVGVEYGTQDAVVMNVIHTEMPVPIKALSKSSVHIQDAAMKAADSAMTAARDLKRFTENLLKVSGVDDDKGLAPAQNTERVFLHQVEPQFLSWLGDLPHHSDPKDQLKVWQQHLYESAVSAAKSQIMDAGSQVIIGRVKDGKLFSASTAYDKFVSDLRNTLYLV